ncbi:PREDICTED: brevican core protein isoform X2 [Condylura cristata]|uniref:brevican core protein isoform X1 n=1 Tax=Condylura cristata TaxID=143302 RepID=UPI000642F9A2|nr:PREDICTED: brevican core protein isoform X1 [Condylura cristata]XP_012588837.1 PREDICTED: brevican core protein isoform X1 [Condylura cristata]XP_012588838.1 PREDICTED: brevican core protein isoform X1 [Condylura cristata]XP_012588839.1 PREDICTED: brevican core protein isoform X1 [Condylura cristata]XP_012588840.1 PREDICTED: brevican core protein isoform X1 [Condylura cristata]XP_012588841.1 PREDICTED: brevican core protein isoform X1 [Condylura cristata]XP_012588842.1 PREDICTED: brevican 
MFPPLLAILALARISVALADALDGDSSEDRAFRVLIAGDAPLQGVLGGALTIPCHVHYLRPPPSRRAVLGSPRVKWTFLSGGREAEVLVARGLRVKVSEAYRFRVALPAYPASLTDVSLVLSELRPNDSGIYRCEVQHGIDDSSDAVEVKVKGVVFLYREGSARYAFSFTGAQEACARIGARIATPEQLYAAYLGGYEQCDAGWLSDQTVRYPIQTPREACYGDMDGFPGVRNYGVVDPDDLYDVYCYAEDLNGELFLGAPPDKLTLEEARAYCRERGAEIATTGQLYAAWDGGLDRCSPGWLADGSVRYPIVTPSQRCGGGLPGVKTLFLFPNQTGFPNKHSRFNVYCFRDSVQPSAIPEDSSPASEPASDGLEAIVTVTETLEELQLPQEAVESESRGAIYSIPIMEDGGGGSSTPEEPAEAPRTLLEFETQSIVPPMGSSEEEGKDEEDKEEEAEEEEVEEEALWAWPSELSSPDPETPHPTLEDLLSQATPPTRATLQPGASQPPHREPEAPRPPRVFGPPTETLPTPRKGNLASPPPSTPIGAKEVGEETGGPELSGVPKGESEEIGSSEEASSLLPATQAPEGTRELEAPSEENSGRTVPAGTSVRAQPVLPTDSANHGGVAMAPSSGNCVPSPCHNGGTCLEEEEGVRCLCLPGYGGDLCNVGLRFCSPGWDAFQGACYKHFSTRRSWEEAETQCRMYGAHLTSISTPEEQDFINNRYREYQWIGLNDRTIEGDFLWSDGVPLLYENWNPGQPDSYFLSGENCVVMVWHDQGQWSDVPCNYHLSYTCKMGLVSCGPPPELPLAQVFGRPRLRYEVDTVLRYRCREGLAQRNLPLIRCQENGHWEPPQISCVPRRPAQEWYPMKALEGPRGKHWKAPWTSPSSSTPGSDTMRGVEPAFR